MLAVGRVLQTRTGQRYKIERYVGHGSTARVYAASDLDTGQPVAVRFLRDTSAHAIDRFQLEAFAYASFSSPHLPRLHATDRASDGAPYMVLDLLQGETLAQWLDRGVLSIPAVVELGTQLMQALHHVHSHGLVHCDIKPANIFIETHGGLVLVKLIDFGICRHVEGSAAKTAAPPPTVVRGTPAYMSPEQIAGGSLDLRSDLYSAAAVLYRGITGRHPFCGRTPVAVMASALRDPIVPPSVLRLSCPIELERVIMKALCRETRFRYRAAHEIADELGWIGGRYAMPRGRQAWSVSDSIPPPPHQADATRRITGQSSASAKTGGPPPIAR
jgi:serine/threonine protein kinase